MFDRPSSRVEDLTTRKVERSVEQAARETVPRYSGAQIASLRSARPAGVSFTTGSSPSSMRCAQRSPSMKASSHVDPPKEFDGRGAGLTLRAGHFASLISRRFPSGSRKKHLTSLPQSWGGVRNSAP